MSASLLAPEEDTESATDAVPPTELLRPRIRTYSTAAILGLLALALIGFAFQGSSNSVGTSEVSGSVDLAGPLTASENEIDDEAVEFVEEATASRRRRRRRGTRRRRRRATRRRRRRRRRRTTTTAPPALPLKINERRRRAWGENADLTLCRGDCNWELQKTGDHYVTRDNCPDETKCFRWGVPPGCSGTSYDGVGYCYNDDKTVLMIVGKKRSRTDLEILFARSDAPRSVDMIAASGENLKFHLDEAMKDDTPQAVALTTNGRRRVGSYKDVVLQEYYRIPVYRSDRRRDAGKKFTESKDTIVKLDEMIRARGGRTVLMEPWGNYATIDVDAPEIWESHKIYVEILTQKSSSGSVTYKPLVAPVGHAYKLLKDGHPDLYEDLWESDHYHASETARYFGALVLFETISGTSAVGMPGPTDITLADSTVQILQSTAHKAVQEAEAELYQ